MGNNPEKSGQNSAAGWQKQQETRIDTSGTETRESRDFGIWDVTGSL